MSAILSLFVHEGPLHFDRVLYGAGECELLWEVDPPLQVYIFTPEEVSFDLGGIDVADNRLGEVFAAETGFLLSTDPDTVRAPDAAFVNAESMKSLDSLSGYLPVSPDLVVEVVSPSDKSSDVEEKAFAWLGYGTRLVLVTDPANQIIRSYRDSRSITVGQVGDTVDASDVVSDWTFSVPEIFAS